MKYIYLSLILLATTLTIKAQNVGIGTTTPQAKVEVRGNMVIGDALTSNSSTAADNNIINLLVGDNANGATNGISFFENSSTGFAMKLGYDGSGTGPTNAMRFYSDADASLFSIENGGEIGIGVDAPSATLDVVGTIEFNGQLDMTGDKIVNVPTPTNGTDAVNKDYVDTEVNNADDDDWTPVGSDIERQSGNVYIGNSSGTNNDLYISDRLIDWDDTDYYIDPNATSDLWVVNVNEIYADAGASTDPGYTFKGDQNTGMHSPANHELGLAVNGSEAIRINASADVGIGDASPNAKLDVEGELRVSGGNYLILGKDDSGRDWGLSADDEDFRITEPEDSDKEYVRINDDGSIYLKPGGTSVMTLETSGEVGIGDETPDAELDMETGNIMFADADYNGIYWGEIHTGATNGAWGFIRNETSDGQLELGSDDQIAFYETDNMDLMVDWSLNNGTFNFNGRITSNGINETSDARFKKDVQPLESSLNKVLALEGVSYYWDNENSYGKHAFTDDKQIGVIAQQVEPILPEVVTTDDEGFKSVQYSHMVPVLIEAVKEQQAIINGIQQENEELKAELDTYRDVFSKVDVDQFVQDYSNGKNLKAAN